jgi:hypothetical protein
MFKLIACLLTLQPWIEASWMQTMVAEKCYCEAPPPETNLDVVHVLNSCLVHDSHEYVKILTHLKIRQYACHHVYFTLKWMNDGAYYHCKEADFG